MYERFREHGVLEKKTTKKDIDTKHDSLLQVRIHFQKNKEGTQEPIRLITKYVSQWRLGWSILNKHCHTKPQLVACRPNNLKDMLVHSEYTRSVRDDCLPKTTGMYPCGQHCSICPFVEKSKVFTNADRSRYYQIKSIIKYSSSQVLYVIKFPHRKFYIGKTKRQLKNLCAIRNWKKKRNREKKINTMVNHFRKIHRGITKGLHVKGFYALSMSQCRGTLIKSSKMRKDGFSIWPQ